MADYKRLTLAQRYLIQSLHHQQYGQEYIAKQVGVSQSTICRELAKYNGQHPHQVYQAQSAQQRASQSLKRTPYKFKGSFLTPSWAAYEIGYRLNKYAENSN